MSSWCKDSEGGQLLEMEISLQKVDIWNPGHGIPWT